jgi:hypothetical protein
MRPARFVVFLVFLFCIYFPLHAKSKHLIVTGKLTELAAVSGQSAGWAIRLNPVITVDGKQLSSVEIQTPHAQKLESLQEQFVQASGSLVTLSAADSADRPVLKLSSIHSVKYNNPESDKPKLSFWSSVVNFFSLSHI